MHLILYFYFIFLLAIKSIREIYALPNECGRGSRSHRLISSINKLKYKVHPNKCITSDPFLFEVCEIPMGNGIILGIL